MALVGQKSWDQAIAHLQASLRIAPTNADALLYLAEAFTTKQQFKDAEGACREACRLQPQNLDAQETLGMVLFYQGKLDEAAKQLQQMAERRPSAKVQYCLALALHAQGDAERALPHYREAVRLETNNPTYLNDLAWLLATHPNSKLRDGAEAVRLAEEACRLTGGKEARFFGTLDAAYAEAGRFEEAVNAATKARDLATAAGQPGIAQAAEERMALYRTKQPYRQAEAPPVRR